MLVLILAGCASTGAPSGGPKDIKPPVMDTLLSTKNRQLNFKPRTLTFHFDEFIEVRDASKQVLVSPPLSYIPTVKHRGKKVTFSFNEKEVLRDNATYTINFGEAIVDFHEGNKLNNFTFVFATGDVMDSLVLKGKINNALTQEAETDMVVFLYDDLRDSIVRKEKPFYSSKPNKDGYFEFTNIKSDTFRLFAIKDENLNFRYDQETEKMAFHDTLIILDRNFKHEVKLYASLPKPYFKIMAYNVKTYGKINILCNSKPPDSLQIRISDPTISLLRENINDSINLYYQTALDSFYLYVADDTIKVKPGKRADYLKKSTFKKVYANNSPLMLPSDSLVFSFNLPVGTLSSDQILLYDTIGLLENVVYSLSNDKKSVIVKYPWVAGEKYVMEIDSGLIKSIYDQALDSLGMEFSILTPDKTASLKVSVSDLDSTAIYQVNVLKDKTIVYQKRLEGVPDATFTIKGLVPDRYNIEIIKDDNNNGKWDAGDYSLKKQPERYKLMKGDKLRENRETEMAISWTSTTDPKNEPSKGQQGLESNKLKQQKR